MAKPSAQAVRALSPGQAVYVLERLIADRRITQGEVNRYAAAIRLEIRDLEARLQRLQRAPRPAAAVPVRRGRPRSNGAAVSSAAPAVAKTRKSRRTTRATPEQIESRQLQGRYLSLIRRIPANKRAQYTKLASDKGREAAIRQMQAVLRK